ncbi:hypothetical protein [Flexithrix dorotheae]|uniref:hypothetical protein n=1 Tax=Flexithrix dorotheae TaxID=70993 RepID=UPI0003701FEE|nr:hypothetical protein [Flexithrix dorotheae]
MEPNHFIYNSRKLLDKKLLGYTKAVSMDFLERDISKNNLTSTQLFELAEKMNKKLIDMIYINIPDMDLIDVSQSYSEDDIATMIINNPDILRTPIVYLEDEIFIADDIMDINKIEELAH